MKKILNLPVNADGMLSLSVMLGKDEANKIATVSVEVPETARFPNREAWLQFIDATAGSIQDPSFFRHPQGELEERTPLS